MKRKSVENVPAVNDNINGISDDRTTLDLNKALRLRLQNNHSYGEIAKILNQPKSNVYFALRPFTKIIENPAAIKAYSNNRADILTAVEMQMVIDMLDDEKRKKATLGNSAYGFSQIAKEAHLAKGESTGNYQYSIAVQQVSEIDKEIEDLEGRLEGN